MTRKQEYVCIIIACFIAWVMVTTTILEDPCAGARACTLALELAH